MTQLPRRIVDGGAGDWERSIILSAGVDVPSEEFRRRLRRKIGVTVSAAGLTTATASAKSLGGVLLKWLTLGFTVGTLAAGTASYAARAFGGRAPGPGNASASPTLRRSFVSRETSARAPLPPGIGSVAAPVDAPPTSGFSLLHPHALPPPAEGAVEPRSAPNGEYATGPTQLGEQIAAIKAARAALASNAANRALSELDRYERTYPTGLFEIEAQVLRIDALLGLGQHAAARALAQRFLVEQPDSPYARHVRSVTGAAARTPP